VLNPDQSHIKMLARSVLITGCNRGIGLELVKQWLKVDGPPEHIIATCRKPEEVNSNILFVKLKDSLQNTTRLYR
jgi:short-subunit dehydrogenase involved in D-alanine esterification of teichoic acids